MYFCLLINNFKNIFIINKKTNPLIPKFNILHFTCWDVKNGFLVITDSVITKLV